jgi:DegV family protein with EDD domain
MAVKIITDSSCDLPDELLNRYNIEMIPLKVTFDDHDTYLDRFEISPAEFVKKMQASKTLPKTSAPDPQTFITSFEKGLKEAEEIIFVSLSSALSSTHQTALMASEMIGSKNIQVFDSLTASLGTGIAAIKAVCMAAQGLTANAIMEQLNAIRKTREVLFTLDTLENVVRGGRLSSFEGMAGTLLNIKPILRGNSDGVPVVVEKVRGRKKAIHRLVSMLGELQGDNVREKLIGISHVSCSEEAQKLAQAIKEMYSPKQEIIISEMGATLGTYAGVGGLMINI